MTCVFIGRLPLTSFMPLLTLHSPPARSAFWLPSTSGHPIPESTACFKKPLQLPKPALIAPFSELQSPFWGYQQAPEGSLTTACVLCHLWGVGSVEVSWKQKPCQTGLIFPVVLAQCWVWNQ